MKKKKPKTWTTADFLPDVFPPRELFASDKHTSHFHAEGERIKGKLLSSLPLPLSSTTHSQLFWRGISRGRCLAAEDCWCGDAARAHHPPKSAAAATAFRDFSSQGHGHFVHMTVVVVPFVLGFSPATTHTHICKLRVHMAPCRCVKFTPIQDDIWLEIFPALGNPV